MSGLSNLHLLAWVMLTALGAPASKPADQGPPRQADKETIEEVIDSLRSNNHQTRQAAIKEAVDIGEPIVPALLEMVLGKPGQGTFDAQCAMGLMGPKARPALPRLLALAGDMPATQPAQSQPADSARMTALILLRQMGWAADEVVPVLRKVAENPAEDKQLRTTALSALGGMGKEGIAVLRKTADGPESELRKSARQILSVALEEQGIQTRCEYFAALVEADPFGPKAADYLMHSKGRVNLGKRHPPTEKLKAAYRAKLKEKPDPQMALKLAEMIQNGLAGTELEWAAPSSESHGRSNREDPAESFATLAEMLTLGLEHAEKGSEIQKTLAVGLAKLRLSQGDWEGMNKALEQLGWAPVPLQERAWLAGPPVNWGADLSKKWTASDAKMRSGECGLAFHVEKDGKGLRGVHVLVKKWKKPGNVFYSGINPATLFLAPQPLAAGWGSFGYGGQDREMTRYGVTDATGEVKFEKLPEMEIQIELLAPTGSFPEAGRAWDLWMEVEPGKLKQARVYGGGDMVDCNQPPAVAELQAGRTVYYPRLVVLPQLDLGVDDWDRVDPERLELSWPAVQVKPGQKVTYELEMTLSGPSGPNADAEHMAPIRKTREVIRENRWPVSEKGVGGQKLAPGHVYVLGLVARNESGGVVGRAASKRVWTPWKHRKCAAPVGESDAYRASPIQVETWHAGTFGYGNGRSENLREKVERFLREYPDAFEREYVQVGKAWLDWDGGDKAGARKQLEELIQSLSAGSVPQATAAWLLEALENGEKAPQRLKLAAPRMTEE